MCTILPATNLLLILVISIFAIHNFCYLSKHRNHKSRLGDEFSHLYPFVAPDFYSQPLAQQTVENNQEIHEINKKIEELEKRLERLEAKEQWNNK